MPPQLVVPGSPPREHQRSRAAQAIARISARSGLFFSNFEHRATLPWPTSWLPPGPPEPATRFVAGLLAEPKYQAFRHDLLIASFHPCHRSQWTAHELCHGLVGFAYRPGATSLFNTMAAWLAELLPVTLWYFFDEADAQKCPAHAGSGPLFQTHCEACEQAALAGPRAWDRAADRKMREGRDYLKRELLAIKRSRKRGRPEGTRYATIDLAQDSLRYAASHGARLAAPEMERFATLFFAPRQGLHDSLEALESRVIEVADYLCGGAQPKPWRASAWDYVAQDVGYRLMTVRAELTGTLAREVDAMIDGLASERTEQGVQRVITSYRALESASKRGRQSGLIESAQLFAVGYSLPDGQGHALEQLSDGIASACPSTWAALKREQTEMVRAFAERDAPARTPIGRRFASFLAQTQPGPISELAHIEAAITHAPPRDLIARSLRGDESRDGLLELASDVQVLEVAYDVLNLQPGRVKSARPRAQPYALLVLRSSEGEVDLLEVDAGVGRQLAESRTQPIHSAARSDHTSSITELQRAGVLVPRSYAE